MLGLRRALPLLLLLAPAALAQVQDDFADGDFTADPAWTGDTDRFTVVPFGADFALRSDGLAASDTIALATASSVDKVLREKVKGSNLASAKAVGELIADRLKEKGVTTAVFDRGGYRYHGKVKALADAARAKGLSF